MLVKVVRSDQSAWWKKVGKGVTKKNEIKDEEGLSIGSDIGISIVATRVTLIHCPRLGQGLAGVWLYSPIAVLQNARVKISPCALVRPIPHWHLYLLKSNEKCYCSVVNVAIGVK